MEIKYYIPIHNNISCGYSALFREKLLVYTAIYMCVPGPAVFYNFLFTLIPLHEDVKLLGLGIPSLLFLQKREQTIKLKLK